MEAPPALELLPSGRPVSDTDVLRATVRNFGTYHAVAARLRALQAWAAGLEGR